MDAFFELFPLEIIVDSIDWTTVFIDRFNVTENVRDKEICV